MKHIEVVRLTNQCSGGAFYCFINLFFFVCYCFVFVFVFVFCLFACLFVCLFVLLFLFLQFFCSLIIICIHNILAILSIETWTMKSTNTNSFNNTNQSSDKPQASMIPYVNDISPVDQTNKQAMKRQRFFNSRIHRKDNKSWTAQRHVQWMFVLILILANK